MKNMKKQFCAMGQLAMLLLLVSIPMHPGEADAWQFLACYQLDNFPAERYKLAVGSEAAISELAEEVNFGHPHQIALGILGKHIGTCGRDTVRPVQGTLIATDPLDAGGARLGLVSMNTTNPAECKDVEVHCKATDTSAFPPPAWACDGQSKFGIEFSFNLIQVDETRDSRCSLFQDPPSLLDNLTPSTGRANAVVPSAPTAPSESSAPALPGLQ